MKNRKALILLFCANAISGFAQGISMLAIPWYFARLNQATTFNLIFAFVTFATLIWGLFAGTLVDRFPRKTLFLFTNLIEGIILISIAMVGWYQGSLPVMYIIIVFTVTAFGFRMHYPNLYAFVQEISPPKDYAKVTSYIEIVGQATNVLAGAFAVILLEGIDLKINWGGLINLHIQIDAWAIHKIFTMDGITYFLSFVLITFIHYIPDKELKIELGSLKNRLKSGFRFLLNNRTILLFGFFSHSIFVIFLVTLFAVTPMYITNFLREGGEIFGSLELLYGIGALAAGIFITRLSRNLSNLNAIIRLMMITTLILFLCATVQSTLFFLIVGVIIGFTNAGTRVLRVSYLLNHIPNDVVGRVNSIFSLLNIIMRGIFVLIFSISFFSIGINIIYAYVILSFFTLGSGLILWRNHKRIVNLKPLDSNQ